MTGSHFRGRGGGFSLGTRAALPHRISAPTYYTQKELPGCPEAQVGGASGPNHGLPGSNQRLQDSGMGRSCCPCAPAPLQNLGFLAHTDGLGAGRNLPLP